MPVASAIQPAIARQWAGWITRNDTKPSAQG